MVIDLTIFEELVNTKNGIKSSILKKALGQEPIRKSDDF